MLETVIAQLVFSVTTGELRARVGHHRQMCVIALNAYYILTNVFGPKCSEMHFCKDS